MKTVKETTARNGNRLVTVELAKGETLACFHEDGFYQMGDPLNDIIAGHMLLDAVPTTWCSISQKWIS